MMELLATCLTLTVVVLLWYINRILGKNRELESLVDKLLERESVQTKNADFDTSMEIEDQAADDFDPTDDVSENKTDVSEEDEKNTQRALAYCKYCEGFLGDEEDHFEIDEFKNKMKIAIGYAQEIDDDFFRDTAYHRVILLLARAGLSESAKRILSRVTIDMIRDKILDDLEQVARERDLITRAGSSDQPLKTDT